jgi:AAA family ATP:ADP antiporter
MHKEVLTNKLYFNPEEEGAPKKKKKEKPGLMESFKIIVQSPELGLIALLIMAYGVTINLVEVQWKNQLGLFCSGDKGLFNYYMGILSTSTGIFTILFGLFVGSNILRKVSWAKAAMITPLVILVGGGAFFCFILAEGMMEPFLQFFNTHAIAAAMFIGLGIVVISKAIKYILFDPTKEMAYIPLDDELKTKGKAAVDVIGGRAGKAGGAFVQSNLQIIIGTIVTASAGVNIVSSTAPYAFVVFAVICVLWLYAVKALSKKVDEAVKKRQKSA